MKLIDAYKKILALQQPVFYTDDISIVLNISNKYGYKILKQLSEANLIVHLKRGCWSILDIDPMLLPNYLTAPMPSYISLQTALYFHGMISQVPAVIYAISLAKTRVYRNAIGDFSIHHINSNLFAGYQNVNNSGIHIATPEKAIFDFFYFKSAKTNLFAKLPEIEIPEKFNWKQVKKYADLINNVSRRQMVINAFSKLL